MESTLADIRQLFNVLAVANAKTIDNLAEGELGIYEEGEDTSIASTIVYATLPEKFRLVARIGGKLYFSFDTIEKARMRNTIARSYQAETVNIWKGIVEGCGCDCMTSVALKIGIDEAGLIQEQGLTWTHADSIVEVSPKELACMCDCEGKEVYQNHLFTQILFNKIQDNNSPYYEATVEDETGTEYATAAEIQTFIDTNKDANLGSDASLFSEKLVLVLKGKVQNAAPYADLDINYVTPRGVRLTPSMRTNGTNGVVFTEEQDLAFEIGAGADLRAEEWENMNFYTTLNFMPQLSDGLAVKGLQYQFKNGENYDGLVFEFTTPKVERNTGESRLFGVFLGSKAGSAVTTRLKAIFLPA